MSWLGNLSMLGGSATFAALQQGDIIVYGMLDKNVAGQKLIVYAFNTTTGLPVTGDAANITCDVSIDGGAATGLTDVNPVEITGTGAYLFDLTQAETNGELLVYLGSSTTANVAVNAPAIYTRQAINSEVIAALTSQGYSVARAAKLDFLTQTDTTGVGQVITAMTQPDTLP